MRDQHPFICEPKVFQVGFRFKRYMTCATFQNLVFLVIDNIELHRKTLTTIDWDRLMIDDSQEVFVGCHRDNNSIKGDGFEFVSSNINNFNFLIISNSDPMIRRSNSNDIFPAFFPRFSLTKVFLVRAFEELDSILCFVSV